jgi:hypothetical protein
VACHSVESFRLTRVDTAAHARYRYPLEGAHRATPCQLCHRDLERTEPASTLALAAAVPPLRLDEVGRECASCHRDPHEGQFEGRDGGASCDRCHSVERFRPAERFHHDLGTKFALTGGHRGVACDRCHHPEPRDGAASVVRYRPVSVECRACHAGEMLPAGHGGRADR